MADELPGSRAWGSPKVLEEFANDIGLAPDTVEAYRWVSSRWPKSRRRRGASHHVHAVLASLPEESPFEVITHPPTGMTHWTTDAAKRAVGQTPARPETFQEKVNRVHELAKDDAVAAAVTGDLLRRPEVAVRTMADPTARHQVNQAQRDIDGQSRRAGREKSPMRDHIAHQAGFVDAIGVCHVFVAGVDRALADLDTAALSDDDRVMLARNLAKVHDAADRLAAVLHDGHVDLDRELAKMLAHEGEQS